MLGLAKMEVQLEVSGLMGHMCEWNGWVGPHAMLIDG